MHVHTCVSALKNHQEGSPLVLQNHLLTDSWPGYRKRFRTTVRKTELHMREAMYLDTRASPAVKS